MKRREFITLLGGVAAWPLAARAQSVAKVPIVTLINARRADAGAVLAAEFRKGLSQTGLTEGKDVLVEYHWLDGHYENTPTILNDAIRRQVAVIATPANTAGSLAAKAATSTIPIVFGVSDDPVALGLVANMAKYGAGTFKRRKSGMVVTSCLMSMGARSSPAATATSPAPYHDIDEHGLSDYSSMS